MLIAKNALNRFTIGSLHDPGYESQEQKIQGIAGYHGSLGNLIGWILDKIFHLTIRVVANKKVYYLNRKSFLKWLDRVNPDLPTISPRSMDRAWVRRAIRIALKQAKQIQVQKESLMMQLPSEMRDEIFSHLTSKEAFRLRRVNTTFLQSIVIKFTVQELANAIAKKALKKAVELNQFDSLQGWLTEELKSAVTQLSLVNFQITSALFASLKYTFPQLLWWYSYRTEFKILTDFKNLRPRTGSTIEHLPLSLMKLEVSSCSLTNAHLSKLARLVNLVELDSSSNHLRWKHSRSTASLAYEAGG